VSHQAPIFPHTPTCHQLSDRTPPAVGQGPAPWNPVQPTPQLVEPWRKRHGQSQASPWGQRIRRRLRRSSRSGLQHVTGRRRRRASCSKMARVWRGSGGQRKLLRCTKPRAAGITGKRQLSEMPLMCEFCSQESFVYAQCILTASQACLFAHASASALFPDAIRQG
jgi:hypothetical protein